MDEDESKPLFTDQDLRDAERYALHIAALPKPQPEQPIDYAMDVICPNTERNDDEV